MRHKKFLFLAIIVFTANPQLCFSQKKSQGIPAGGHAKLIVEKVGEKPVTYNFPDALPAGYNCIVHNDGTSIPERSTEIIFMYTFENGGKQTDVMVSLRIEPNGVGNFPLDPPMPDKPVHTIKSLEEYHAQLTRVNKKTK